MSGGSMSFPRDEWERRSHIIPNERSCELSRRIGFAIAEITEAMGFLEDCQKSDARYWAMKALIRARDMLTSGSVT